MKEYLLIFRGGETGSSLSQEEMQKHMTVWGQWMGNLTEKGQFVGGDPLEREGNILYKNSKGEVATDGPFPEAKELVGGYLIIKAKDQNEANEISKGCPIFEYNGTVEVRQLAPIHP